MQPADLAGLLALAVCSVGIARRVVVEPRPGWREPVNLYAAVLLEPGNRKWAVFADAMKPLRELEAELIEAARPVVARGQSDRRQDEALLRKLEKLAAEKGDAEARHQAGNLAADLAADLAEQTEPTLPRLLAVCNPTWRVIVALSRYGGLRCPSEVLSLRWQDIDWDAGRIVVQSPKTEHHVGKASRTIPLFAELRPILAEAFEIAAEGAVYVVDGGYRETAMTSKGWANCNLRTQLERLLKRAGLQPWPRLFHAMRASRETELAKQYPIHVVTAWLGNTPRIALKHYLQVTDSDFERAAETSYKGGAESGARCAQNTAQPRRAANGGESHSSRATPAELVTCAAPADIQRDSAQVLSGEDRI